MQFQGRFRTRLKLGGRLALAASLLLIGFAGGSASANHQDDPFADQCREECSEARRVCHRAARAVYKECHDGCGEEIRTAVARAKEICEEEGLEGRKCAELVRRAVHAAQQLCRDDCQQTRKRARLACHDEVQECRAACDVDLDDECVGECRDEFAGCREDLGACQDGCREAKNEAIEACREHVTDVCDPVAYKECVREARVEFRACASGCHDDFPCASDLRSCLGTCVIDDEVDPVEPGDTSSDL